AGSFFRTARTFRPVRDDAGYSCFCRTECDLFPLSNEKSVRTRQIDSTCRRGGKKHSTDSLPVVGGRISAGCFCETAPIHDGLGYSARLELPHIRVEY